VSIATAAYTRKLLDPRDSEGNPVEPSPSIAALSPRACHLWEVLSNLANVAGEAFPSVDTLARRMHIVAANVRRARAELVAAGVIAVDTGGGRRRPNVYRFPVTAPAVLAEEPPRHRAGFGPTAIHNPRATARVSSSTSRATPRGYPRAAARGREYEGDDVDVRDAIQRADSPIAEDSSTPAPAWRAVIDAALAADDARRAAQGLAQ
jgi:hypothetical protein